MSTLYKYTVIAKEGDQGIDGIGYYSSSPSINDAGTVAFGGYLASVLAPTGVLLPRKSEVFVGDGSSLTNLSGPSFFQSQQINNAGQVIAFSRDPVNYVNQEIRLFDSNNPGQSKLIAKSGVDYRSVVGNTFSSSVNNLGESVFIATSPSDILLVTASEPPNSFFKESDFSGKGFLLGIDIRIADNGDVLIGDWEPGSIDLYDKNLKSYKRIASARGRFSELSGDAAISDDGKVVTFSGTDKDGSGIFAWSNDKTVRIAGISGDGILDPGETYQDKNGNGKFDSGEIDIGFFKSLPFYNTSVSFDLKSPDEGIGTVAYIATDTNNKEGLYTSSFRLTDVTGSNPQFEIFAPNVVAKEGDEISGLGEIRENLYGIRFPLRIHDSINKSGQVAFVAFTDSGYAVVRASPISYPDTTPLNIELAGGQFKDTDNDGDFDGQGTIYIGRTDGIARMLRVENATAEYDDQKLTVKGGTVFSEIGGVTTPLFRGDFEIPFSSATTSSLNDDFKNLGGDFKLAGLDVDFNKLSLNRSGIGLGTSFVLPKDVGNITVDSVALGLDTISIDQSGISLGASGKLSLPNPVKKPFFNLFDVEWSNISLEYDAIEKKFKLQGKLTLDSFIKDPFLKKVTADLSGDNFIQIKDGKADVVGSLIIGTDIKNKKGWGLSEIKLDIDTINQEVKGTTRLTFPFKGKTPDADIGLGFKTPIPPLEVNELSAFVNNVNVSIPSYPLVYFQKFGGYVKNFAPSDPDPIEFGGGIGATLGPQINLPGLGSSALIRLDVDGKISSEQLSATGKGSIIADTIANFQGTHTLNWNKKFYEAKGSFSVIDGLIQTQNSFKADTKFNINMAGMASGNIPNILNIPFIRGKKVNGNFLLDFSNDSNLSNDFAAVWSTFQQNVKGVDIDVPVGLKGFFDGRLEPIFASLPPTNSFIVSPGNPWILLSADWTNSNENVQVRIEKPDGTFVEEADFSANNIAIFESLTDSNTRAVAVINPTPGIWDIEVVDDSNLGDINYSGIRDSDIPEIKIIDPSEDIRGGEVTINYEAFDSDSNAEVKLFYDDDNEGFDGILIADNLIENDGISSFVWNTEGVATGDYFIYGMVMDENNAPVFSYSQGKVRISDENVNYIPVATNDTVETNEDQPLTILPSDLLSNDSDIDGDRLTITEVNNSTNGIVKLNTDGNVLFTPDSDFNGLASFEYTVSDGTETTNATVEVTVNPVNDLPVATNDTVETNEDQPLTILPSDLLSNDSDIDGDDLTITQVNNSANGTVELNNDGNILFTPDNDFNGLASFEYTVSDGTDTTSATVEITVNPVNDENIIEGTTQRDSLLGTDSNDIITGFQGADRITTGDGEDKLVYNSIVDAGDLITDFDPLNDVLDLQGVLQSIGFDGSNAIDDGYVQLVSYGSRGTSLQIDADGTDGSAIFRPYLFLQGVSVAEVNDNSNSLTFG